VHTSKVTRGVLILFAGLALLAGCGDRDTIARRTPKATAKAFLRAMKAEEYDKVVAGCAVERGAHAMHPDWAAMSESEKGAAIAEARDLCAKWARSMHSDFAHKEVTIGTIDRHAGTLYVEFKMKNAGHLYVGMVREDEGWKLTGGCFGGGLSQ